MNNEEPKQASPSHLVRICICVALSASLLTAGLLLLPPIRSILPGYLTTQSREQVVGVALRMDSLEKAVTRQNMYVTNLQDILKGQIRMDSIVSIDSLTALRAADLMEQTEREREYVRQYEESEKYNLTSQASRAANVYGLNLVRPVQGLVISAFDPYNYNFGVKVSAIPGSVVTSVMEGTVLLCNYMANDGYTIMIQHNGDLVSIITHCGTLLKKKGDKVVVGEALATVEDAGDGSCIYFELWHKGIALDPSIYIAF